MKTKPLASFLLITLYIAFHLPQNINAQTVDLAVKVLDSPTVSHKWVYVVDGPTGADEWWYVVGACKNNPSIWVYVVDGPTGADKWVYVVDSPTGADKWVCITNANDLDKEMQEKLKLR
jgi:hypothetical protein